jgi:hypothetical protein
MATGEVDVVLVGADPNLGMGGDIAGNKNVDPEHDPQMYCFKTIADGLTKQGMVRHEVLSHDCVLTSSSEPTAFNGWLFVRSILYGATEDRAASGFDRYSQLCHQAVPLLSSISPKHTTAWTQLEGHNYQGCQDVHRWSVGLSRWAAQQELGTIPVDDGNTRFHGGPMTVQTPDGKVKPLMVQRPGEVPQQMTMPFEVIFGPGLRMANIPTTERAQELFVAMCEGAKSFALRHDVFSSSANAIRWLLAMHDERQWQLYIENIDNFAKVRDVAPGDVGQFLSNGRLELPEETIKRHLESILDVPLARKDSPAELDDIYTSNVLIEGARQATSFMLKGPAVKSKELENKDCGAKGSQLVKLFDAPAVLFVVQFIGPISQMVIKDVAMKTETLRSRGKDAHFLIMDGQDTARLLYAYGFFSKKAAFTD